MLVIRREQMAILERAVTARFAENAVRHFHDTLPAQAEAMGDTMLRDLVHAGMVKGKSYGLQDEYDYLRLMNLMFTFGVDFEQTAEFTWARNILEQKDLAPRHRIDLVTQKALDLEAGRPAPPCLADLTSEQPDG